VQRGNKICLGDHAHAFLNETEHRQIFRQASFQVTGIEKIIPSSLPKIISEVVSSLYERDWPIVSLSVLDQKVKRRLSMLCFRAI
jgi:hypothetical protein